MFRNRFLDYFSRIHPSVPLIIYGPIVVALIVLAATNGRGVFAIIGLFVVGLLLWTLSEYWLHRTLFHWETDHPIGSRMHFIIHGVHHDHPNDRLRLVMPPAASLPIAAVFFGLFWLIFGIPNVYAEFAGFLTGYLIYDYTHYYVHHRIPKTKFGKKLREQHMRHHFQDHRYGFGVSTPFWDAVFQTLPRRRGNKASKA